MDRKLAHKNYKTALITGAIAVIIFGLTFVAAYVYNA